MTQTTLLQFESDSHVAEAALDKRTVGKEGSVQIASPDYVILVPVREFDLESIGLGVVLDHCVAFPGGGRSAVVFDYHKGKLFYLVREVRQEYRVERNLAFDKLALDHYHKVRHRRAVLLEFVVCLRLEAVNRPAADKELRGPGEPGIEVTSHSEILFPFALASWTVRAAEGES